MKNEDRGSICGELECKLSREAWLSAENLVPGLVMGKGFELGKGFSSKYRLLRLGAGGKRARK